MSNEYTAWFPTSEQISEDRWHVIHPHLKITDETTIGEIREWYKRYIFGTPEHKEAAQMSIQITQLQNQSK